MKQKWTYFFQVILIAVIYCGTARLSLFLAFENTNASPVWPPSAIGFAAILFLGYRVWPGVAAGAFFANGIVFLTNQFASPLSIVLLSLFIAAGNTLEAVIGVYLLKRLCGTANPLEKLRDLVKLLVIIPIMCLASSLVGPTVLCLSGNVPWVLFPAVWFTWWIGDLTGILVFSPLLFAWRMESPILRQPLRARHAFSIFAVTLITNYLIFGGEFAFSTFNYPYDFIFVPLVVWASFYSDQRILGTVLLITCGFAIWGTTHGYGPFVRDLLNTSLLSLQVFVGILAVTGMALYVTMAERRRSKKELEEKENRYHQIINFSMDAFITIDDHGKIIEWNEAAQDIFGWKKEEVIGKHLSATVIPLQYRQAHEQGLKHYRATKQGPWLNRRVEITALNKQGKEFPVELAITPIQVGGNQYFTASLRDLTWQKQIQEVQSRLAAIVASSDDAIISMTMDGIITSWNEGAAKMYGYSAQEVIGRDIKIIVPEEKLQELSVIFQNLREGKEVGHLETKRMAKGGKWIDVSLTISHLKDADGKSSGASSIGHDITLLKQAENALREREKWFRSLIENSSDLLLQLDLDGRILYTSPSVTRILGYGSEERIGHSILELIHPEDLEGIRKLFLEVLEKEDRFVNGEARIRHKNGTWRWIEGVGHNLLHEPGIQALVVNCRDATERKLMDQTLKQNEEKFRRVVEYSPNAVIVVNEEGDIVLINEMAEKLFLYKRRELIGNSMNILIPADVHARHEQYKREFLHNPSARPMGSGRDLYAVDKNGERIPVEIGLNPIQTGEGKWILASIIDIRERKRTEARIKEFTTRLKESNKELEQFAFIASHDMQEPLRIVSSYAHLLAQKYKNRLDAVADKYIDYVVSNVARMQGMVNGLLEYSRLGRQKKPVERVDTTEVCDQAISNLAIAIKRKRAKVVREVLPVVVGNKMDLIRLFQNLISNAIKYCDKKEPLVRVSATKDNSYWIFSIEDNGIGIENEYHDQIFDVFKRLHTRADYSGSGMGLAICKKIVEQTGGRIWVESEPNIGSRFYFTLPKMKEAIYEYTA